MSEYKEEKNKCVKVNIFVKCKDDSWKKEEREETCVEVNIYVECEECKKGYECE